MLVDSKYSRWPGCRHFPARFLGPAPHNPPGITRNGWEVRNLTAAYECGPTPEQIAELILNRAPDLFSTENP